MSFNTSNIQADTFTGSVSLSAPIHYVAGIPISNNTGNLKLGDVDNAVVECLELESGTSVTAPLGEFDLVQTSGLISQAGLGESIQVSGSLNLSNYALNNVNSLTLANGATGSVNQVLSVGATGALFWKTDANDVANWATFPANSTVDFNTQSITGSYADGEGINVLTGLIMNNKGIGQASMVSGTACNFETVQTGRIYPYSQVGDQIFIDGFLNMQGYGIAGLDSITLANGEIGANGQVLSVTDGSLIWKDDSSGDVSQWATFDAVQDVNLNDNNIIGASNINTNIITTSNITSKDGANQPILIDGILNINNYGLQNVASLTVGGSLSGSENQVLSVDANGNLKWKDDSSGDVSQWATFDAVQDVNMNDFVLNSVGGISGSGGSINLLSGIDADNNNIGGVNVLECKRIECEYRPENTYYVSANGDDSYARGNIESPFQTIQQAITFAENYTGNNDYKYIVVLAGNYNENLTITKRIHLIGMATSPFSSSVGCAIGGSITINVGSNGGDLFNNAVNISGFLIGSQVSFVSTENSILNINDCYIYTDDNTSGRGLYFNPTCENSRLRITNSQIISGGSSGLDPLVEITKSSSVTMNNVIINSKGIQNVLKFSGTATCDSISNCRFISDTASAVAPEIVSITSTNSGTYTFSSCGFQYGSTTNKTANPTSSGIRCSPSSGNPRVVILYCSFFLLGTNTQQYAVEDANHAQPNQMIVLYYMNGASLQNAFAIHANNNQNKFQLQVVS
jgi:hypothetical protein